MTVEAPAPARRGFIIDKSLQHRIERANGPGDSA